jgi:hypothetical protein
MSRYVVITHSADEPDNHKAHGVYGSYDRARLQADRLMQRVNPVSCGESGNGGDFLVVVVAPLLNGPVPVRQYEQEWLA